MASGWGGKISRRDLRFHIKHGFPGIRVRFCRKSGRDPESLRRTVLYGGESRGGSRARVHLGSVSNLEGGSVI
ncbi:hypothetical protein RHMOL_Rhmol07G0160100 [Rhododendron molle]|uniref:Uncharacterized protein n=1 Tax=Rhododendron molle TaxID=49168 RepID=A0ACC0N1U4_RHOML|nr:hypothetical protein RHMOL_Rhmol07G0160100 [Rhododendron molle]